MTGRSEEDEEFNAQRSTLNVQRSMKRFGERSE